MTASFARTPFNCSHISAFPRICMARRRPPPAVGVRRRAFATVREAQETKTGIDGGLPPFPADVPTHPLFVIDHARIEAGDEAEVDRLWHAATTLGFW
jgi:hypothetical protein